VIHLSQQFRQHSVDVTQLLGTRLDEIQPGTNSYTRRHSSYSQTQRLSRKRLHTVHSPHVIVPILTACESRSLSVYIQVSGHDGLLKVKGHLDLPKRYVFICDRSCFVMSEVAPHRYQLMVLARCSTAVPHEDIPPIRSAVLPSLHAATHFHAH